MMRIWTSLLGLTLASLLPATAAFGQESPQPVPAPANAPPNAPPNTLNEAEETPEAPETAPPDGTGETAPEGPRVIKSGQDEEVRVLKPQEIPTELLRLKSKADIKAEITLHSTEGRPVVFRGVIRNGKLIERIVDRRFVIERDLEHAHSGVRVWWSGGSDGYIFFRYSAIKTLSITGTLTDAERAEIFRRLKAKREGRELPDGGKEAAAPPEEVSLEKMSVAELELHLLHAYPADKGWDQKRYRDLKRKQLIENQVLDSNEATFVQYFNVLTQVRFRELKRTSGAVNIAPGTATPPPAPPVGVQPTPPEPDDFPEAEMPEGCGDDEGCGSNQPDEPDEPDQPDDE